MRNRLRQVPPLRSAAREVWAVAQTDTGKPRSVVSATSGGSVSKVSMKALERNMIASSAGDSNMVVIVTLLGSDRLTSEDFGRQVNGVNLRR
ncbi:hypothetical protein [Amycolatopsis sp. NPDC004625]|uniref:hypothetical protein n=1 Tax=Amycolatopsis sp. NPDC004625 TaxID=3154670 RepID=UPI0033B74594